MFKLFSKRNRSSSDIVNKNISDTSKTRILAVLSEYCYEPHGGFDQLLEEVGRFLFKQYGGLKRSAYDAARISSNPVIEHFYCSDTIYSIDFIEACFQQQVYNGGQDGVNEINEIFLEENIGYELTPFTEHHIEKEGMLFGSLRKSTYIEYEYPRVVVREQQLLHEEILKPAFHLLTDSRLQIANSEMLKAHTALRSKDFEAAITLAGSSFESFLKTICEIKGWPYDKQRDTCSKLVKHCKDKELFPSFYVPVFESIGTIRNKLSDAHGRGPSNPIAVTQEYAEHMIHLVSSHMVFLEKLAKL
jgi:hypothetical protein